MALTEIDIFHPIFQKGLDDAGYVNRMTTYFKIYIHIRFCE